MPLTLNNEPSAYDRLTETGLRLASLSEAEGGWAEYFDPDAGLDIADPILKSQTAILLENCKRWQFDMCKGARRKDSNGRYVIDEAVRSALVGGYSDYLFPVIRAAFPTNPINELVSVQPTNRRVATVVYWNWTYGSTKGANYLKGTRVFDANTGRADANFHYSDETVQNESLVTLGSAGATITGTLTYSDGGGVRPNTVALAATLTSGGAKTFFDNGNGGFTASGVTISAGTINYQTGAISITITGDTFTTATVLATYEYDSEGSLLTPEMDVQITTSTSETMRRALKLNYSIEAMTDVMNEFGVALEPNLIATCAEQMNFEIARQIISDIWGVAPVVGTFGITPSSSQITQQAHFGDLIYVLNQASNAIWAATQKAFGNWIIVDQGAANLIESLPIPLFQPAPRPANVMGIHFIGTLAGKFRVYKDIHLSQLSGASAYGNMLMGWKGDDFFTAGYVWAPYQMMYTTDSIPTSQFTVSKGLASRYATKMINARVYCRISLTA